ncbi:MAG: calcium/sodium antiporter [Chloroflexi bacterium]|nr:calcium/sodium antiporter [Chloroflexota bacterium]
MALNSGYILIGLLGLFFGGNYLVQGSSRLASSFGVSPLVIGLTIVAVGTSTPELLVSVTAALRDYDGVSLGNIIGSNIANIGLILGLTGLIVPIGIDSRIIKREIPIMIGVSAVVYVLALNNQFEQLEGILMLVGMVVFNVMIYMLDGDDVLEPEFEEFEESEDLIDIDRTHRLRNFGIILMGIAILVAGAQFTVSGATVVATELGVSELVIGFTIVAFGTSLPELATSIIAATQGEADIAIGNIVGSNIANLLLILGATVTINPMGIDGSLLRFEFPAMLVFAILMVPFAWNKHLRRRDAAIFLVSYLAFVILLITT